MVAKTFKLYINGAFPRTESGRSLPIENGRGDVVAHLCRASRKDFRNSVEAAAKAQPGWAARTGYNRGQILYRMAEMLEGKHEEFQSLLRAASDLSAAQARTEVDDSIDRLVTFAGWADKYAQILGCNNPVAGPYYNFTVPEPTGVVAIIASDEPALLGLVTLLAAPLCAGNTVVLLGSEANPLPAAAFGEVCATSDVPAGVVNILTGHRDELLEHIASHREVNAISAANPGRAAGRRLRAGAADNVKRIHIAKYAVDDWRDAAACAHPWAIEPFVEMKTIWHPAAT